jgi:CRISPR-associated protein Csx17
MAELRLGGCTPEPLMGYLKAVGVLRIVAEQADRDARGSWNDGIFVLETKLCRDELIRFFLEEYRPTPIVAPWAGGSGFFGRDNRSAVDAICESGSGRLAEFAALIRRVDCLLRESGVGTKPSAETKEQLLRLYRRELPDEFVRWIDTAIVLRATGQSYPPLLGTGGNDGRLDFSQNYMQRLVSLGFARDRLAAGAPAWLRQALFAEPASGLLSAAVGQFDPGRAGGPNATTGMEGGALVNPWDYSLMLEGTLLLAGSAARRLGHDQGGYAAFPFTVRPSTVGYGSEADAEAADSRGEIWLPLWEARASMAEVRLVFTEGRAEIHGRQSRDGVDFARAVASLGIDRGISAFVRYGFLRRSGKAYVATALGSFPVRALRTADLLREVDRWLEGLRRSTSDAKLPARFRSARHRIESAIFDYCRYAQGEGDAGWIQTVLAALGAAQRELSVGDAPPAKRLVSRPLAGLSSNWLAAADDGSVEFRLARSIAFLGGGGEGWSIRRYLEPVRWENGAWRWSERGGHVTWAGGDLSRNMGGVLVRRLMDASKERQGAAPLGSPLPVSHTDIAAFLHVLTDDQKLEDLLWGLMLVNPQSHHARAASAGESSVLPRVYGVLKLTLLPGRLEWAQRASGVALRLNSPDAGEAAGGVAVKPEPAILARLRAGRVPEACTIAVRRLEASGFFPLGSHVAGGSARRNDWRAGRISPARLLAALLFPISNRSVSYLGDLVLHHPMAEPPA